MFKFSLIVPTRGRPEELVRLFDSLKVQTLKEFEVILIDQNADEATQLVVDDFVASGGHLVHLKPGELPLSRARNTGLPHVKGQYVAFPDDDCHYPSNLLNEIFSRMEAGPFDIVSCRSEEPLTGRALLSSFPSSITKISERNLFGIGMSITLFFRFSVVKNLKFDESLGVGCEAGSGEETDYLFKAFRLSGNGVFFPDLKVFHPFPNAAYGPAIRQRAFKYGHGFGVVLRRYFTFVLFPHFLRGMIIRPLGGALISIYSPHKMLWCLAVLRGRWWGFLRGK